MWNMRMWYTTQETCQMHKLVVSRMIIYLIRQGLYLKFKSYCGNFLLVLGYQYLAKLYLSQVDVFKLIIQIITPHFSDVMGIIVLTSFVCVCVCPSVCLAILTEQTDIRTCTFTWRSSGRMHRSRSKVKVTRSKNVYLNVPLTSESLVC